MKKLSIILFTMVFALGMVFTTKAQELQEEGCTRGHGYWKTHSGHHWRAPYDETWDLLLPDGADTLFFDTGQTYYEVLRTPPKRGNAFYILARQYIAAELNFLNEASLEDVQDAFDEATDLLDLYDGDGIDPPLIPKRTEDRILALRAAGLLVFYNAGIIGPGSCEEEEEEE